MITEVLWWGSDYDIREELIISAQDDITRDGYAVVEDGSWADAHVWSDNAKRSDRNIVGNLSGWINRGKRAYLGHLFLFSCVRRIPSIVHGAWV